MGWLSRIHRFFAPDYTDGAWHVWRAGMRPVPADAIVTATVMVEGEAPSNVVARASALDWGHQNDPVLAFRYLGRSIPTDGRDMTASARALSGPEGNDE
ncbi:hypothetical protein [Paracoccus sp. SY]|uniref:hypothetical protein n=1 Tax=Paracoccus sp. SY TaxID=1330255 RepID=UPI000CD1B34B|nr:hypothetical protein [Paracoccus sp. SY]